MRGGRKGERRREEEGKGRYKRNLIDEGIPMRKSEDN